MSNWIHKLDLKDLWDKYEDVDSGNITDEQAEEVGKIVAERLHKLADTLPVQFREDAHDLAYSFEQVSSEDELNGYMSDLWDLGDTPLPTPAGEMQRKLIWVSTSI